MAKSQSFNKAKSNGALFNPAYGITAASALAGITALIGARMQNSQIESKAQAHLKQQHAAKINEQLANMAMHEAYSSGAYQAMMQGLQDAQIIAQTRAMRAGSGVRLGVGSAAEVEATQKMNAKINQQQIQKQTVAAANNHLLEASNYRVQQIIAQGDAQAARALKVNPLLSGISGFIGSATALDKLWQDNGKNKSVLFNWLNKYF